MDTKQILEKLSDLNIPYDPWSVDSLQFLSFIMTVEQHFDIQLKDTDLQNVRSIGALVDLIEKKQLEV